MSLADLLFVAALAAAVVASLLVRTWVRSNTDPYVRKDRWLVATGIIVLLVFLPSLITGISLTFDRIHCRNVAANLGGIPWRWSPSAACFVNYHGQWIAPENIRTFPGAGQ